MMSLMELSCVSLSIYPSTLEVGELAVKLIFLRSWAARTASMRVFFWETSLTKRELRIQIMLQEREVPYFPQ